MPKYIPDSVKLEAMQLYLEGGKTAKEIADIVSKNGVSVKPPTIYAWAKKEAWDFAEKKETQYWTLVKLTGLRFVLKEIN